MNYSGLLRAGRQALESQPFSKLLNAKLRVFSPGEVVLEVPITEELMQQHGFVHGGVISYAADNCLTFVGASVLGAKVLTSEYKINYLRPAIGDKLIARSQVVSAGKRQAVCRCDIFVLADQEEKLCATAQGTIVTFVTDDD